ncbi:MAG TPA: DeoR/GlpR family DNA-binding transcription regulator [Actinomycetes bacterium]|nr:DeoR/GlpR family DNA-binding transcription regulator [Actinomycetes bacterium]
MPGSRDRDRQHEVMRLLEDAGRVSVPELAERFGVSLVTVRKDLERLERRRLLRRVRGGAVPAPSPDEGSFEIRLNVHVAEKTAIAKEAARMVRDGDAIAVDGSTTCYYLIKELLDRRGLVVVTNGLPAAEALVESDATVVMPGGTLRRSSWALVGDMGASLAGRGRLTYGFFGLRALSPDLGLLELSPEETAVKRRLVAISSTVYGLFDSSKVGRFALHPFVETAGITGLITDAGTPDEEVLAWKDAGVPVQRVPLESSP